MTTATDLLSTLTAEQLAAVRSNLPLTHVSAGPGSGKTRVIAARIAWLIEEGADPESIACLTFTRAACGEIRERVASQVGPVADRVLIATFHEASIILCPLAPGCDVATEAEADAAVRSIYHGPMRRPRVKIGIETLRRAISQHEADGACIGEGAIVDVVLNRLHNSRLEPTWNLVPRLLRAGSERWFHHVLIDEAQDVTAAEARMAASLLPDGGQLFAVGDPRQAIMQFRGGGGGGWPTPTHRLTRTFRFGQNIARTANALEVGEPIDGFDGPMSGPPEVWRDVGLNAIAPSLDALWPEETCVILTRTHADAAAIEQLLPGRVRHVQRDARADPLISVADLIAGVRERGLVPATTVHGAKGTEYDQVVLVGPSTIRWGLASDDPEERRVAFVGMTRAKRRLVLVTGLPDVEGWRVRADGLSRSDE